MYRRCQYILYCTNLGWIVDWYDFVELAGMGWFESVGLWSTWIEPEYFWFHFIIKLVWFQFAGFSRPNFSTSELFLHSAFLKMLNPLRFSTRFSLSLLIVTCHGETLMNKSNMPQLLSLVLVICGCGIPVVLNGFIPIFHPPSTQNQHSFCYHFSNYQGGFPITVSMSINGSTCLVRFRDDIIYQPRTTYCELFRPYICHRQQEMFHNSAVGVCWLICCQYGYFLSVISTKRSGQLWHW